MSLFDFFLNHVSAQLHQEPDRLSRRRKVGDDLEDSDVEEFLDKFIGCSIQKQKQHFEITLDQLLEPEEGIK